MALVIIVKKDIYFKQTSSIEIYEYLFKKKKKTKHSTPSTVFHYTSFVLWPLPVCFTTEQGTVFHTSLKMTIALSVYLW